MLNEQEIMDLMIESQNALHKLKKNKIQKKDPLQMISESLQSVNMGQNFFEPYDTLIWEGKVRVDMLYYDQLLQKLDETTVIPLQSALGAYFRNIREIYEFVNLRPEVYGKGVDFSILEMNNEQCKMKLSNVIYEYLDNKFYSLTPESRQKKYQDQSHELSKQLISEGVDADEAISFAIKTTIMEDLLTKIAFPFSVWSRIQYLTESNDYREVFDQDSLISLVESFKNKVHAMAKIVATVI
jgi:hypothetical protein